MEVEGLSSGDEQPAYLQRDAFYGGYLCFTEDRPG